MKISQFIKEYEDLQEKINFLYKMKNDVFNYDILVNNGGKTYVLTNSHHTLTKEARDAIMDSIDIPLSLAREEMKRMEERFEK